MRRFVPACATLCIATVLFVHAPQLRAQTQTAASLSFGAVSIKRSSAGGPTMIISPFDSDQIIIANASPRVIIGEAYAVPLHNMIIGLPDWADSTAYDMNAKVATSDLTAFHKLLPRERSPMLQSVLANRFHLICHFEMRTLLAYALVIAKDGPKLQKIEPALLENGFKDPGGIDSTETQIMAKGVAMENLGHALQRHLGRPVVDRTGLTGNYNFTLKFAPIQSSASPGPDSEENGPSIFTAMPEQIGLRLEAIKTPVQVLVVDHIERPSEN